MFKKLFNITRREKHDCVLGISYDEGMLRFAETMFDESGFLRVERHGQITLVDDYEPIEQIAFRLKALRSMKRCPVAIALSDHDLISFTITIPPLERAVAAMGKKHKKGTNYKQYEEQYIEHAIQEYIEEAYDEDSSKWMIEYETLSRTKAGSRVYVVLYELALITRFKELFAFLGFRNISFEATNPLLAKLHDVMEGGKELNLIRIGSEDTVISHVKKDRVTAIKHIPFGKQTLVNVIQGYLDVDSKKSREIFQEYGVMKSHRDKGLLSALELHAEIIFEALDEIPKAGSLAVYGEGAYIQGVIDLLRKGTKKQVEHLDVWRLFPDVDDILPAVDWYDALRFAPAIAVAVEKLRNEHGV